MKKIIIIITVVISTLLIFGCGMKVVFVPVSPSSSLNKPKPPTHPIQIFESNEKIPQEYKIIGKVNVGEAGATLNCGYDDVINAAQKKARDVGGDALQIIEVRMPVIGSTCYTLLANIIMFE